MPKPGKKKSNKGKKSNDPSDNVDNLSKAIFTNKDGNTLLRIRLKHNAKCSNITDVSDSEIGVAVAAPPRGGQANLELLETMSRFLGVPVQLAKGIISRFKILVVPAEFMSENEIREELSGCASYEPLPRTQKIVQR